MAVSACKIRIEGIVQGVGFRFFTQDKAQEYGITGYVKNLYDGSVEAYAEGEKDILEKFIKDLKQGPRMSRVERTDVQWIEPENNYESFTIKF
jgi:acylphosphatase